MLVQYRHHLVLWLALVVGELATKWVCGELKVCQVIDLFHSLIQSLLECLGYVHHFLIFGTCVTALLKFVRLLHEMTSEFLGHALLVGHGCFLLQSR